LTLLERQAFAEGAGKVYATFAVTDAPYGDPSFYIGDAHYYATNVHGGPPVYPVVTGWGELSDVMGDGGAAPVTYVTLTLDAGALLVPTNGTTELTVGQWLRELNLTNVTFSFYQWNQQDSTQDLIWKGQYAGLDRGSFAGGVAEVRIRLRSFSISVSNDLLSDLVNETDFANAPRESINAMVPRLYGQHTGLLHSAAGAPGVFGFPMPGNRGVVVDENQGNAKVTIRFAKNDGTDACGNVTAAPAAGDPSQEGCLWIWDGGMQSYGMVDAASYAVTNDVNKVDIVVERSPKVYFWFKPSQVGSMNAAGFTSLYKLINKDLNDFIDSTVGDFKWSFMMPSIPVVGNVLEVGMVLDWANVSAGTRTVTYGLRDRYGPGYIGPKSVASTRLTATGRSLSYSNNPAAITWLPIDTISAPGSTTAAEFKAGKFISRSAGDAAEAAIELYAEVTSAAKDGARLYGLAFWVAVEYPWVPLDKRTDWFGSGYFKSDSYAALHNNPRLQRWVREQNQQVTSLERRKSALERLRGTDFFIRGQYQFDTAGTYSGAVNSTLDYPNTIAHHILGKLAGRTMNVTAGTLGNWVDPRTYGALKNMAIAPRFGSEEVTAQSAIDSLESRFPMRIHSEDGVWLCLPDDMNPHSSRFYRSTSAVVDVTPEDVQNVTFEAPNLDGLVNRATVAFGHGYPDREAGSSYVYDNPVSQKYFGLQNALSHDEPWISQTNLANAPVTAGVDLAKWLGRKKGWPRATMSLELRQKFYELKRGHVLQVKDLELRGLPCTLFRCGLLLYYFTKTTDAGSGREDMVAGNPHMPSAGTDAIYLGFGQQVGQVDFHVQSVAAYTTVANGWEYWNPDTPAWVALAGVVNADALKAGTGTQTVSFTRPSPWLWGKDEQTFTAGVAGPCYWLRMKYNTATGSGACSSRPTYPATWYGRLWEVLEASRIPGGGSIDEYPLMRARLQEVM